MSNTTKRGAYIGTPPPPATEADRAVEQAGEWLESGCPELMERALALVAKVWGEEVSDHLRASCEERIVDGVCCIDDGEHMVQRSAWMAMWPSAARSLGYV